MSISAWTKMNAEMCVEIGAEMSFETGTAKYVE